MTKKELNVILNSVRHALNNIEVLGFENYPYGMAEDEDIRKMCILLTAKISRASN